MKKATKVFCFVVVMCLILGSLASCGEPTAQELMEKATLEMAKTPHSVTMSMSFSSEDASYNRILSMMSVEHMKMEIDGDKIHINMSMDIGVAETTMDYTVVDGMLYMKSVLSAEGETQSLKQKAEISAAALDDFLADLNPSQDMKIEDFANMTMKKEDDVYVITCKGFTNALNKMLDGFTDGLEESFGGFIEIDYAEYVVKIEDDKITSADLICTYSMTVDGQEIKFSMNSDMTYKYNDNISVTAPSDASAYEMVDYDELMPA